MRKITKATGKLLVNQETIRRLSDQDMRAAKGGAVISNDGCSGGWTCDGGATCNPSDMTRCV